jgi:hypothetical protein
MPADQQVAHAHFGGQLGLLDIVVDDMVDLAAYRVQAEQGDPDKHNHQAKRPDGGHDQPGADFEIPQIKHCFLPLAL